MKTIIEWFDDNIYEPIRIFFRGIIHRTKKTFIYAKYVWTHYDYDWDWAYLFMLMKFKMEAMSKTIRNNQIVKNCDKYADQIDECIVLMGRILDNDYCDKEYEEHTKKWGKHIFISTDNPNAYEMVRENVKTKKDEKKESKEFLDIILKGDKLYKKDWDELFKKLKKNINNWWD